VYPYLFVWKLEAGRGSYFCPSLAFQLLIYYFVLFMGLEVRSWEMEDVASLNSDFCLYFNYSFYLIKSEKIIMVK
jgi:hypothetical protein